MPTTTATTTNKAPLIAAALLGLDMGPFIGRPPGQLYDGRNVVCVDDHVTALIVAQVAALQLTPHRKQSTHLTQQHTLLQLAGTFHAHLGPWESPPPTMTAQIQEYLGHVGSVPDEVIVPSSLFSFRYHRARGGNRTHNLRFTRAVL